jgi:hypothetical protein
MNRALAVSLLAAGLTASAARADVPYLVGFVLYRSTSVGASVDSNYFYTSNTNLAALRQTLTPASGSAQTSSISFELSPGANTFRFTPTAAVDPGEYAGVQLYFNTTGSIFEPNAPGFAPNLAAFVLTDSSSYSAPSNGTNVIDYGNSFGALVPYSGATSFTIGGYEISVSSLTINHSPSGSVTLSVVAVPAPATIGLLGLAGLGAARRRR